MPARHRKVLLFPPAAFGAAGKNRWTYCEDPVGGLCDLCRRAVSPLDSTLFLSNSIFCYRIASCRLRAVDLEADEDQNYVTASERFLEFQTQVCAWVCVCMRAVG